MDTGKFVATMPKEQITRLTYKADEHTIYIITSDANKYYLYLVLDNGYKYLKSRTSDPLFKECYPEYY